MARTAFITGASSGIGASFAHLLAAEGCNLVLTARREDRLMSLAEELRARHGVDVHVLAGDLADPGTPVRLHESIKDLGLEVDILVNNAGYGFGGTIHEQPLQDIHDFLQVLLRSWVDLVRLLSPGMLERGHGRIINVASVASYLSVTSGSLYGPIKAFILQYSRTLHLDLGPRGVNVTALCPGYVRTEFFEAHGSADRVSRVPGFMWLDADRVARAAWKAVERGRAVCVPGLLYKVLIRLVPLLPARWRTPPHRRRVD
ncbi:MAG: dehydrogenase [Phycisphaerae bacterium]|nr:dehydrogenase [Phycisphaerae bacterium]